MKASIIFATVLATVALAFEAPKVNVLVDYDTLDLSSKQYWLQNVVPAQSKLGKYIQWQFVPFGHCKLSHWNNLPFFYLNCEHGPDECYCDEVHTCAFKYVSQPEAMDFITCIFENTNFKNNNATIEGCAAMKQLNRWADIEKCAKPFNGEGNLLMADNWKVDHGLEKTIESFPWVFVDNHQVRAENNLVKLLCQNQLKGVPECN